MPKTDTAARVGEAVAELEKATVPVLHEIIGVAQKNADQMSATGKEVLQILDNSLERISGAAVRLASSSAELAAAVLQGTGEAGAAKKR